MEKCLSAITVHLSDERKRQFSALARYQGLDCSSLGRSLVEAYIEQKHSELSILLDVFDVEGTGGTSGTGGAADAQ